MKLKIKAKLKENTYCTGARTYPELICGDFVEQELGELPKRVVVELSTRAFKGSKAIEIFRRSFFFWEFLDKNCYRYQPTFFRMGRAFLKLFPKVIEGSGANLYYRILKG